ncbi:TonB-dependent siderophore receptor [Nostoc sp.]|uniref:TonB-dependent siderophore receptor n=1 Tax=Nostoc sp. TaxID=1180 RepID=UPI002FFA3401
MKRKLLKTLLLTSYVWLWGTISAAATEILKQEVQSKSVASVLRNSWSIREIRQLSEIERPSTSAQQLLVQLPTPQTTPAPTIQITGVKANPTDKGVEIILETPLGTQLQVTNRSTGNNFIADVSGGQLRLPSGEAFTFRSEKPLGEITEITVTNIDANTVRVTVVGVAAMPTVELFDDNAGLVFGVASAATATQPPQPPQTPASETPQEEPAAQQDEPIELVVTGEQDRYNVPDASTATHTDTPLRDIPQSIQVIPRQVLEDRKPRNLNEAVETVSGVVDGSTFMGSPGGGRIIRGFFAEGNLRNGYPQGNFNTLTPIGTIEQVEVLKGPASVLFGALEPGGIINTVTKQPLSEPYYKLGFEAGSYGYYQPSIDFSGPLNADKTLLYRLIAGYEGSNNIQEFVNTNLTTIAPSITWKLGDRTELNLYYEYIHWFANPPRSFVTVKSDGSLTPRSLYTGYPDFYLFNIYNHKIGYTLKYELTGNWQIRNNVAVTLTSYTRNESYPNNIVDDRFLTDYDTLETENTENNYFGQIDLLGKFNTGSISHQLLVGFDIKRNVGDFIGTRPLTNVPPLDILNPNYDIPRPEFVPNFRNLNTIQSYGVYLQDQIAFSDNLKLLIGGRYDWVSNEAETIGNGIDEPVQKDSAFSPRIGLVYQPSKTVSLYASYSRSFLQTTGSNPEGSNLTLSAVEPTRGTQYEVGVKTDFLDGKLSATLAAYQLTKTNVLTTDPANPRFFFQTGELQSRGIELDVTGEILPGWNVIASYAYTDGEVTKDKNIFLVGNRLEDVPEHQASLWTTYKIQTGDFKGLGFGLGLFYVGEKQGDLANSFTLRDYFRTDAALYYRKDGFNAAINIRNLFDIDYANFAYGRTTAQRDAPLTIVGSISWEF